MSAEKRDVRRCFREAVLQRDGLACVVCGRYSPMGNELDAHHVWPREKMPYGGYVCENGVTLCDHVKSGGLSFEGCHAKAERVLAAFFEEGREFPALGEPDYEFSPSALYVKIGSSLEQAIAASSRLASRAEKPHKVAG
jgi:hypothetical protein